MKRVIFCSVVPALCLMLNASADASLITNGSFELPALSGPTRVLIGNLTDWQASGGFSLLERGVNTTSQIAAFDGQQFVSMGHNGATGDRLSQTFSTTIGTSYTVDFHIASIQGSGAQTLRASVFDSSNSVLGFTDSNVLTQGLWISGNTLQFTATTTSTRLEFLHTVGASVANIALDGVVVDAVATAVPEPSSVALMLTGLVGAGFASVIRRNRR